MLNIFLKLIKEADAFVDGHKSPLTGVMILVTTFNTPYF